MRKAWKKWLCAAFALGGPALISDETVERIMNKETGE